MIPGRAPTCVVCPHRATHMQTLPNDNNKPEALVQAHARKQEDEPGDLQTFLLMYGPDEIRMFGTSPVCAVRQSA